MTELELKKMLIETAEKILGRKLTDYEKSRILEGFQSARGTIRDRTIKAIGTATQLTNNEVQRKAASQNDTDRLIDDLENKLK